MIFKKINGILKNVKNIYYNKNLKKHTQFHDKIFHL